MVLNVQYKWKTDVCNQGKMVVQMTADSPQDTKVYPTHTNTDNVCMHIHT